MTYTGDVPTEDRIRAEREDEETRSAERERTSCAIGRGRICPRGNFLVLEKVAQETTRAGIHLPSGRRSEGVENEVKVWRVLAMSPDERRAADGATLPRLEGIEPGTLVIAFAVLNCTLDGEEFHLVEEPNIIAVIERKDTDGQDRPQGQAEPRVSARAPHRIEA